VERRTVQPEELEIQLSEAEMVLPPRSGRDAGFPYSFVIGVGSLLALTWYLFRPEVSGEAQATAAILMLFIMLAMRLPVGIAMAVPGALGIWAVRGWPAAATSLTDLPYVSVTGFTLSVLPMFIFMGLMLWRSGATGHVYEAAKLWIGWVPGGLAITTNFAGAGLAAASGSTIGITYALGRIGIPEMLKAGYDRRLSVAAVLMAGTGGQLIPPSILLVVYAGVAEQSIGAQLLAGFFPGVLLALAYGVMIIGLVIIFPKLAPRPDRGPDSDLPTVTWSMRWASLLRVWPIPLIIGIVVGGIYGGVFTATEAGAFGALGSLIVGLFYLDFSGFRRAAWLALKGTVASIGAIMFLLMGAAFLNRMIIVSGAARWFAEFIEGFGFGRLGFLLALIVLFLVLGMFMDPIGMMLVTVPLLLPAVQLLEINLVWFGVFVVLLAELSILTPPVGILAYVLHGIVQDPEVTGGVKISIGDVFTGALWFIPISILVLIMLIIWPEIALWLPEAGTVRG
jgi:C4-dicarboxylate transporter, DctM subunit